MIVGLQGETSILAAKLVVCISKLNALNGFWIGHLWAFILGFRGAEHVVLLRLWDALAVSEWVENLAFVTFAETLPFRYINAD